ncbi:MAG: hypothetical protein EOO38_06175 [Cytophagaceae bacterium]|nr:MAG: hypothetical protein EOO38_06175 [Cytophagaceae bacterium]
MFRIIDAIIIASLWLQVFVVPAGLLGFAAYLLYNHSASNLPWSIAIAVVGVIGGICLAERIRRRKGLVKTFARLLSTPELYSEEEKRQL